MKKILSAFAALVALTACNSSEPKAETAATNDGKAIVENIMTRTSIRQYTDQAVGADTIETLIRAGMAAPTAVNKQPWHFVVVTYREKLNGLAVANPNAGMAQKAPLSIVVCGDMKKALEGPCSDLSEFMPKERNKADDYHEKAYAGDAQAQFATGWF